MTVHADGTRRPASRGADLDRLGELEEERRFLLRSLRDLEREHAAGDVDDVDLATLRDGYTARAAEVLRAIEDGRAALPPRRERSWRRLAVGITLVAAASIVAGVLVARSSGERLPGQVLTGGAPTDEVAALLVDARARLDEDPRGALERYDQVLAIRPEHPEALTYGGWLLYTATAQSVDDETVAAAVAAARQRLDRAIAADPTYPDAHCFRAIIVGRVDGDAVGARAEAERCLALDAPAQMRALMESFLADLPAG